MSHLTFRNGTHDKAIWESVFDNNEYRLPDRMDGAIVLDIGCHIGSFASACKKRGAREVWGVEASIENLRLAMHNVAETPGDTIFQPFHAAAWRSDLRGARVAFGGHDGVNTGGSWAIPYDSSRDEVPSIPFDDLVKMSSDWGRRRLDWVKLDCEGGEWPILFTSRGLHLIDHIVGEYHCGVIPAFGPERNVSGIEYNLDTMKALLIDAGFAVEIVPPNWDNYNLFFSHRERFGNVRSK